MARSQVCLLVAALRAALASGFCVWKPTAMYIPPDEIRYFRYEGGRDTPKVFSNFSAAADACLVGKTSSNCRQILCTEDKCVSPSGQDIAGMRYVPSGNCYQPLLAGGYCNRRSWYTDHPCKLNREDYCCEGDCTHCGPRSFCAKTFGTDAGVCNPQYRAGRRPLCSKYYQECSEGPNPGRQLTRGIRFNTSTPTPVPPPPVPLSTVQLGGGVKTKSCARHGLSAVTAFGVCELVAQAIGVSSVMPCDDEKECSKRPYGCIIQKLPSCPDCRNPTKAVLNLHGQHDWCGVGNSEYDRFDCICLRSGSESMLGRGEGQGPPADKQVADKQVANAQAEAHKAEVAAAQAKRRAEEGWKIAAQMQGKLLEETHMYKRLETELAQWKELAQRRQEWQMRNASNAAEVLSMREEELRWVTHKWLAATLGLTGMILVCAMCVFGMVCCFTFRYARVGPDAREPKISELQLQDAFVQADPTSEFSQMQA